MGTCWSRDPARGAGHEPVAVKRHTASWPSAPTALTYVGDHEFSTWDLRRDASHNQRTTAFLHPTSGQISAENMDFILQEQPQDPSMLSRPAGEQLSSTTISDTSTAISSSTMDAKGSRASGRVHSFGKREQAIKRNPNVPVVVRGWLYKQDSSGMRLWKRKWFVLADFCLFYYKDSREEAVLGSIPLPSYVISPVGPEDHISRKYAFKAEHTGMRSHIYKQSSVIGSQAEHTGMRTYLFSADTQEDMNTWLRAMNQATLMQGHAQRARPSDQFEPFIPSQHQRAVPQANHVSRHQPPEPARPGGVHEVLLEPADECCSFHRESAAGAALEMDTRASLPSNLAAAPSALPQLDRPSASAPVSRAPSRAASALPAGACARNGLVSTPSPILEPNGIAAGTYQRAATTVTTPPANRHQQVRRRSTLEEVEQWVKVQKAEHKGPPSRENTLPRRTPPTQHKFSSIDAYQTLPKTPRHSPTPARLGEYKYAQDRLSHFRLAPDPGPNTTWQLYEWQQRHQYRHGSPTAPLYTPAPDYPFGPRPPTSSAAGAAHRSEGAGPPRCVSVPPSPAAVPPSLSPARRPHTPAERLTVRPAGERSALDGPFAASPRRAQSQMLKTATIDRRSMPPSGYITHTVSAPSLHGKTIDDTYLLLKQDLEYLDLKVTGSQTLKESGKPVKVAESDVDVKLSRLCEQDKILKDLEASISSLKEDKDKLESVLAVSHHQMEQYQEQPAHAHKIAYQQRLLQEDLVAIRAQISRRSTEMARAWEEYGVLESSVEQLRTALQAHMNHSATPQQEKAEMKRELWRIEDVMGGLSASKANYKITVDSVQNPERKLVPSLSEVRPPPRSFLSQTLPLSTVPKWAEDSAPPRPPLPCLYDYEDVPPAVPPLPKEASVIRHTSVRGLKRQSDERKRDREGGQYVANGDCKADLRSYVSEPELPGLSHQSAASEVDYQYFQSKAGLSGGSFRPNQSNSIASYVTLRRGPGSAAAKERPKSALERLSSPPETPAFPSGPPPRGRMTVEEQLERMKRHQRALVRERKRNLSQGERSSCVGLSASSSRLPSSSSDPPASVRYPPRGSSSRHREHHHCCFATLQPPATQ